MTKVKLQVFVDSKLIDVFIDGALYENLLGAANGIATLGADGKLSPSQIDLPAVTIANNVDDYAALLALNAATAPLKTFAFVADASGDATVNEGWAIYYRFANNGGSADWVKITEQESLDVALPDNTADIAAALAEAKKIDAVYVKDEAALAAVKPNLRTGAIVMVAAGAATNGGTVE